MAAIKDNALSALTLAALSLPGMLPGKSNAALPAEQAELDLQYGHYQESDDRVQANIYQGAVQIPTTYLADITGGWVVDTWSGATPVLTMPAAAAESTTGASDINKVNSGQQVSQDQPAIQVMTGASPQETRYAIDAGFNYYWRDLTFRASANRSEEPDYLVHGYHLGMDWELNQKMTTVSLGFSQNFDKIEPTTRPLTENKTDHHFQLGLTEVLNKFSLLRVSSNYSYSQGYLSNPYKKVYIQGLTDSRRLVGGGFPNVFYENRPNRRHQWSVTLGYIRYFSATDAALHLDYRYYLDSWNIDSHTFAAAWHQPLGNGWMLVPRLRYYSQSAADFYRLFYAAPREDNHYSSDFRLAAFGTLAGGLKLIKEWQQPSQKLTSIQFEAGIEYTQHAANLKLGRNSAPDLTDFNYWLATAAIKVKF